MKEVAHLLTLPTKPCILQGPPKEMISNPECKYTLVYFAELPRSRYYPASVYDCSQPVGMNVLLNDHFRSQFGRSIQGPRRVGRKAFRDSVPTHPIVALDLCYLETRWRLQQ